MNAAEFKAHADNIARLHDLVEPDSGTDQIEFIIKKGELAEILYSWSRGGAGFTYRYVIV